MKDVQKVLKKLEYGVYVVTMGKGKEGNAFTASWLTQVSSDPPMVALAVNERHQSANLLKSRGSFVVNLLPAGSEQVAKTYYGPSEAGYEKLKTSPVQDSPVTKTPVLDGAVGFLDCEMVNVIPTGNHTLFVGEVKAAKLITDTGVLTTSNSKLHYTG
jgi:flavin reductase (DIM6/NTAB) family NADH-FMN oxidoreductase RutF